MATDGAEGKTSRKIIIPVDGSKHSVRAFDWYCNTLHRDNDEVLVIHAFDPYSAPPIPYPYGFAFPEDWEQHMQKTIKNAKDVIEFYEKKCQESKLRCTMISKAGEAGEVICDTAKEKKADQIIMGSRGLGTIRRTLVGSISEFCLHHTHIPVSVVPPERHCGFGFINKGIN